MKLTILGSCGTFPNAGGACSGYLLEHEGFTLWIDAGTGTLSNLQKHVSIDDVDAIALSHMHADHFTDLYPFLYAVEFGPSGPRRVPVYAPVAGPDVFGRLLRDESSAAYPKVYEWTGLEPGEEADIGPLRLRTFPAAHSIVNLTMRIEAGGEVFCYSGDTGPNESLSHAAQGADLFLCEASWQDGQDAIDVPIHLTAREAGRVAAEAGAKRLLLTHVRPHYDLSRSVDQAADEYDGIVEIAHGGNSWNVKA